MMVMMAFAKEIKTSVFTTEFYAATCRHRTSGTRSLLVLSYSMAFCRSARFKNDGLCLFQSSLVFRIVIFLGRHDEMEFIHQTRMGVPNSKGKSLLRKFSRKEENDETR